MFFNRPENFWAIVASHIFFLLHSLFFPFQTPVTLFDNHLCPSDWIICTDLFPGSLVLSSVVFSLLLRPSSEVCISHLVPVSARMCV